jgi:transcriptional regulator with XRE-family HTH domain
MPGPWGSAIRQLRAAKGWNMKQLAKRARLSPNTITNIECGRHTQTSRLQRIADAFGVSIESVLVPLSLLQNAAELRKDLLRTSESSGVAHAPGEDRDVPSGSAYLHQIETLTGQVAILQDQIAELAAHSERARRRSSKRVPAARDQKPGRTRHAGKSR